MNSADEIDAAAVCVVGLRGEDSSDADVVAAARQDVISWLRRNDVALSVILAMLARRSG